jgi:hypothetical protein
MSASSVAQASVEYPGLILVDGFIQTLAQGIILAQGVTYWENYADDSKRKQFYVGTMIFLSM